jgi:glutaredoxin 2
MKENFIDLRRDVSLLHYEIDMYLKKNKSFIYKFQQLISKSQHLKSKIYIELKKLKYLIFNNNRIEFVEIDEIDLGYFEYDKCFKVSII